ncbi:dienelactone hydrolase family protein [Sphingomonas sp. BIUV-7]|uniref:Dienelactone hydrolase family protein n=1 Tax=Sphingomonas natans TaxID=3063330 RepID=A0ABT8YEK4_9SPHN|nr:dienelactone hydrolase family protein [Sphingomonas sp. BIUV-7]MDO6416795.1 dienelactone hydrolase family protein [Sphingomonas sp. BIUV-7]
MLNLTRPDGSLPEDFHVSRRTAAGMLFAGYAVAAFSADAAPITTPSDGLITEWTTIPNGAPKPLPAFVARPAGKGTHPTILVVNEVFGIHEWIKDVCRRLAKAGYVAVAPDFFYRSGVDLPAKSDLKEILAVVNEAGDAQVDSDVRATTDWIKKQAFAKPQAIGITGFCWGGQVVWRSAMVDPDIKAGVAWYGQLKKVTLRTAELKAPVLGLYGGLDKGITLEDVAAMRAALKAAGRKDEIVVYPQAEHGFLADYRASYNEAASADAWPKLLAFMRANGVA